MNLKKIFYFPAITAILLPSIFSSAKDSDALVTKSSFEEDIEKISVVNNIRIDNDKTFFKDSDIEYFYIKDYELYKENIENYVYGVVAAEMPAAFCDEALKAQAVAARTYFINTCDNIKSIIPSEIGQSYVTKEELEKIWGTKFQEYHKKILNAVNSTEGLIMTYNDEAVMAVFHSMSGGMTETSENVWGRSLPYLKTKDSHIEEQAPSFYTSAEFNINEFIDKLKAFGIYSSANDICITERTEAGYVKKVKIDEVMLSGDDIRNIFGLRSSCFDISKGNNKIIFSVKGYGHGVGMSQYGAEFMARSGSAFEEILKYYYSGIKISKLHG